MTLLRNKILTILYLSLLCFSAFGQEYHFNLGLKSDTSFLLNVQNTNFKSPYLVNVKVKSEQKNIVIESWKFSKCLISRGINLFSKELFFENREADLKDSIKFTVEIFNQKNEMLSSNLIWYVPPKLEFPVIFITDSTIQISNKEIHPIHLELKASTLNKNEAPKNTLYSIILTKDTTLENKDVISSEPFIDRTISIKKIDQKKTYYVFYQKGKFKKNKNVENLKSEKEIKKSSNFKIKGSIGLETNFFSETPQHSNGSQYPYTQYNVSNTISIYGIPFTLVGSHNTNDNIGPNFRNFFSIQFDANSFRENVKNQLEKKKLNKINSLSNITKDLDKNKVALSTLENTKSLLLKYPSENIELDSLLRDEFSQFVHSQKQDSILFNDSLTTGISFKDQINISIKDTLNNDNSFRTANELKIKKIQNTIDGLKKSNQIKEDYLSKIKSGKIKTPKQEQFNPNKLYSQFDERSLLSMLLRFEKFEIGNFYEYGGKFSINDIEMKGVNTTFLLNSKNKINVLTGKINDFQSFNLENIEDEKKVNSVAISNFELDYFKPTLRVTQFKDKTIDSELSELSDSYYLISTNFEGEVSSWMNYQLELNQSSIDLKPFDNFKRNRTKNISMFAQTYFTPLNFLDFKVEYTSVGSSYQSDGIYFLNRNSRTYAAGIKVRLFKNLLHLKNDFTIIERNVDNRELTNKIQKQFFDIGTHFKRIPNIQISYSPISVEVANKIDTAFSGINANTNVLIARLFYLKKVKRTILSTALIYNEIENELAEEFSTQKGIQHFISISNRKVNFSFTSAYDKSFSSVRFISSTYSQIISKKITAKINLAKNFKNNFYSEIIRSEVSTQILKQFNLGIGGIFLIEEKSGLVNTGGSVSLRFNY